MSDYEEYRPDDATVYEHEQLDYKIFERDGEWWGEDEHGQFRLEAGTSEPPDEDDYDYQPCGAVLTYTFERYGERRYCEALAADNFPMHDKEFGQFCKNHQARGKLMEQQRQNARHLAFVKSYENVFEYLSTHKKLIAIEMFESFLEESIYDYDYEKEPIEVAVGDSGLFEGDTAVIDIPVPSNKAAAAKALWFASLDYVRMENIQASQFEYAAENDMAVGEREKVISVTEDGRPITDEDEHHLNLPLSRIQSDYEKHLDVGGVEVGASEDDDDDAMDERQWVMNVKPDAHGGTSDTNVHQADDPLDDAG